MKTCGDCQKGAPYDGPYDATPDDTGMARQCRLCWAEARQPALIVSDEAPGKCPHLWKRVRDAAGNVVKRKQETSCCGEKELDLFECRCESRRKVSGENDQITLADCTTCHWRPRPVMPDARVLILRNHLSPGDVLCMTAAVHSLHKANPGKYLVAVDTTAQQLWENNPDVIPLDRARELNGEVVQTHYPLVNESNQRAVHVIQGYCDFLAEALKVPVPLATNRPMVYVSEQEKNWLPQVQEITGKPTRYWLVCAGRKNDFTAKFWGSENYQRVVQMLRGRVLFVQVGSAEHHHPVLKNVINLVGKTDQRQLVRLVHHADGVLSGITFAHHLGAALEKPSVTVMGGREPVQWNAYPKNHLFHTIGSLPCCKDGGCWRSRVVKLNDGAEQDSSLCSDPVYGEEPIPRCQAMIRPESVAEAILRANPA